MEDYPDARTETPNWLIECGGSLTISRGGGGYLIVKDYWRCAAGWGRIFTTRLTIMGYIFSRVTRIRSQIFGIFGIRKFW